MLLDCGISGLSLLILLPLKKISRENKLFPVRPYDKRGKYFMSGDLSLLQIFSLCRMSATLMIFNCIIIVHFTMH